MKKVKSAVKKLVKAGKVVNCSDPNAQATLEKLFNEKCAEYKAQKYNILIINKINSSYIKWLIEVLGPIILGSKPAEILNLSSKDKFKLIFRELRVGFMNGLILGIISFVVSLYS